jgi:hypothetical protein
MGTEGKHHATYGGTQTQQDATHVIPISINEAPLFEEDQPQVVKGASCWTENFTELEDVCLCEAWMEVGQDPICGAQQRGATFWKKKIYNYFHEHKHLGDTPFVSDWSEASLTKR